MHLYHLKIYHQNLRLLLINFNLQTNFQNQQHNMDWANSSPPYGQAIHATIKGWVEVRIRLSENGIKVLCTSPRHIPGCDTHQGCVQKQWTHK